MNATRRTSPPAGATFAAQAREAGESDVAKKISALRKPTRSAWVVDHLVRADPDVTGRLADLSGELQQAVSADGARIRELTAARAKLVDDLTQQALKAARLASPPAALREEVTATLDAAIADPEVAGGLGSLVRAERYAGFGPVAPGAAPPPPAKKTAKSTPPADAAEDRARRRQEKIETAERAWLKPTMTWKAPSRSSTTPKTRSGSWKRSWQTPASGWPRREGSPTGPNPGSVRPPRNSTVSASNPRSGTSQQC